MILTKSAFFIYLIIFIFGFFLASILKSIYEFILTLLILNTDHKSNWIFKWLIKHNKIKVYEYNSETGLQKLYEIKIDIQANTYKLKEIASNPRNRTEPVIKEIPIETFSEILESPDLIKMKFDFIVCS